MSSAGTSGGGSARERLWAIAAGVPDPEMPMLTIGELGVLRDVRVTGDGVEVDLTPTYSGCPAIEAIRTDVASALRAAEGTEGSESADGAGGVRCEVRLVLAPAWSTDWISDEGRRKLLEHGIAPPPERAAGAGPVLVTTTIMQALPRPPCPLCGSTDTAELSRFGATACTSLWRCERCREPFEHVKAH